MAGSSIVMGAWTEASPAMGRASTQETMHAIRAMMQRNESVVITRPAPHERIDMQEVMTNMLRNLAYKSLEENQYTAALAAATEKPEIIRADVDSTFVRTTPGLLARTEAESNLAGRRSTINQMMGNWDETDIAWLEVQAALCTPDVRTRYGEGSLLARLGGDYDGDEIAAFNFGNVSYTPELISTIHHENNHRMMLNSLYGNMAHDGYTSRLFTLLDSESSTLSRHKHPNYLVPTTRQHVAMGKHYSGGHHIDYDNTVNPVTRYNNRLVNRSKARAARKSRKRNRGA